MDGWAHGQTNKQIFIHKHWYHQLTATFQEGHASLLPCVDNIGGRLESTFEIHAYEQNKK